MKAPHLAYCAGCQQTFPRSWFGTRDAVHDSGGFDYCSKACERNHVENRRLTASADLYGVFTRPGSIMTGRR